MTLFDWLESTGTRASEIALQLGVSRQVVYAWMRGDHYPSVENLAKLEALSSGLVTASSFVETKGVVNA